MLLIRTYLLLFALCCLALSSANAQNNNSFLAQAANKISQQPATEKVYLHLDRQNYLYGDTIWYKAYTVIGQHHQLSALSEVLHVELIKDSTVSRQTLRLVSGIAWGEFPISQKLKPGNYLVRAYTNWMRNFDPAYFYEQKITIGGAIPSQAKADAAKNPDVQFFPEGGQLVRGIRSRVAIKAVGANGLGQDIKGTIEDDSGNVIADFTTQHLGMGVFAIIPQSGKTYRARISTSGATTFTVDLPRAAEEGFTLALNNRSADSIYIKLAVNEKVLTAHKNDSFFIIAQDNGKVYYTSQGKLENLAYSASVEKSRFPTGITQFTLFSQSGEPLAERVAFIEGADSLDMKISSTAQHYTPRQKVNFDLTARNGGKPSTATFSVAVINQSRAATDENNESTILNNLLLTSDLKGYIEQPNYYFSNADAQKQADLDILMLTQGYRRFEWKLILNNTGPAIAFQPEHNLQIAGTLKTPGGKALPKAKITLFAAAEKAAMDTTTDLNGNFRFTGVDLSDTAKVVLRARKEHNGSNVAIFVKQPDYPAPVIAKWAGRNDEQHTGIPGQTYDRQQLNEDSSQSSRQLKEVTIKDKQLAKPDSYNQYGTVMEYHVDMKRLQAEYFNIKDALLYLVPGMKGGPNTLFYEDRLRGAVKFIIDGFERSASDLNYFLPKEVDNIRVVSRTGFGPPLVILTTKRYAGTDTTSAIRLKEVKVRSNRTPQQPEIAHSDNLNGPGNANQVIMGNKLEGCITLSDCLQGKLFGVKFDKNGVPLSLRSPVPSPMTLIVDGNMLPGVHLNDLNANDIYSIEVLRSGHLLAIYGSNAGGGALVITTKRGGETYEDDKYLTSTAPSGIITYPFKGYHIARVFYSPKYTRQATANELPDLRNTIYWNPNIITDKDGHAAFEYFNNDTKGTYRVVVEGIDDNGNLGSQVYRYQVE